MGKERLKGEEGLRELAAQKEREWREVEKLHSKALESAVKSLEKDLELERAKFHKLKEDFKYNLKLLNERDGELDKYDSTFAQLKTTIAERDGQISDLKIKIADLEAGTKRDSQARDELQAHYQQRLREKQAEVEQYRADKDAEVAQERKEIEALKRNLERQVLELEEELDIQRRELSAGFEAAQARREHEWRLRQDELSGELLAETLRAKLLTAEVEALKTGQGQHQQQVQSTDEKCRSLEKEVKQLKWQLDDQTAMTEAKLTDMQRQVDSAEAALKRAKQEHERKHAEMDARLKEKEQLLSSARHGASDERRRFEAETRELRARLEEAASTLKQTAWERDDTARQAEASVAQLRDELAHAQKQYEDLLSTRSSSSVAAQQEVETLRDDITQLKVQLEARRRDIERYHGDLASAAEREAAAERRHVQADLDWQRRVDAIETEQYEKCEQLVKSLTKARDAALASLAESERERAAQDDLVSVLRSERGAALATLRRHGLTAERGQEQEEEEGRRVTELMAQNASLRQGIKAMRARMENLPVAADAVSSPRNKQAEQQHQEDSPQERPTSVSAAYVSQLEAEVSRLRAATRDAEELQKLNVMSHGGEDKAVAGDNAAVRSHLEALQETVAALRSEKVELAATVRKQQATLERLQSSLDKASSAPRQQEAELAELRYQTSAAERRHHAEILRLTGQVELLEGQLKEAHSTADSYHSAVTEANLEVARLQRAVSSAALAAGASGTTVNYGAQELLIQQLQDEIQRLHALRAGRHDDPAVSGGSAAPRSGSKELEERLRQAARHIAALTRDKQHLIEVGNRLRAQLQQQTAACMDAAPEERRAPAAGSRGDGGGQSDLQHRVRDKLAQLESAQYALTRHQLTAAAAGTRGQHRPSHPPIEVISSSMDEEDEPPKSILKPTTARPQPPPPPIPAATTPRLGTTAAATTDPKRWSTGSKLLTSLDTNGGESLREVWDMLDQGETISSGVASPSLRGSTMETTAIKTGDHAAFSVQGQSASLAARPHSPARAVRKQQPQSPPTRQQKVGKKKGVFKARNWNDV